MDIVSARGISVAQTHLCNSIKLYLYMCYDLQYKRHTEHCGSPTKRRSSKLSDPLKAKRPMNAFMLFAQENRLSLTQNFPGKDNRYMKINIKKSFIFVLLPCLSSLSAHFAVSIMQEKKSDGDNFSRYKGKESKSQS